MFERLGKRALVVPFVLPLFICCVLGLAMAPMLRGQVSEVPFAVVSLDEGSNLPVSDVNVGEELAERLLSGEGLGSSDDSSADADVGGGVFDSGSIVWTRLQTEEELRAALARSRYYGGIVIPVDFTAQQMKSVTGLSGAPTVTVLLNTAKNPSLVQRMSPNLKTLMLQAGVTAQVEEVNAADIGGGTMAPMMAVQMLAMPLFVMSLSGGIMLSVAFWPRDGAPRRKRAAALAKELVAGLFGSFVVACCAIAVDVCFGGLDLPLDRLFPFVWLCAGALISVVMMACDLALPIGALVGVSVFSLGMSCAMLAPEMLPQFWLEWVYPWAPQHYLGEGIRSIVYLGQDAFSLDFDYWAKLYGAAAVIALLAVVVPRRARRGREGNDEKVGDR